MAVAASQEKEELRTIVDSMSPDDIRKLLDYAAFLRFLEDREDAEDAAYIAAHKDEPSIPLEEALKELGL